MNKKLLLRLKLFSEIKIVFYEWLLLGLLISETDASYPKTFYT